MTEVSIQHCENYIFGNVLKAVSDACDNAGFPEVKGKKVLVKPNILSDAEPERCITSHPEVVRAVIRLLKEKGASEVIVGDSPGLQGPSFKASKCGIATVCDEEHVKFVDFTSKTVTKRIEGTGKKLLLTSYAYESQVIIGISKFKTHQLMYATGAAKNYFGLVPGLHKSACHLKCPSREKFAKLIVGINRTVQPAFNIMDAVIGMEGAGPANGNPRSVNLILAGKNAFALDWAEAMIMGYNPEDIPVLAEAKKKKLLDTDDIVFTSLDPEKLIIKDFKRIEISKKTKFVRSLIIPFFTTKSQQRKKKTEPSPVFDSSKCIHCLRCVNICPAKALTMKKDTHEVVINKDKCIRCYCCHEMCPVNAISVSENQNDLSNSI